MAKFNHHKPGFLAGQISPRALGRTDLPQYLFACEEMTNFIALQEGGAQSRPGTQYIKTTQGNVPARLIPFVFSRTESYIMEITTTTIRAISTSQPRAFSTVVPIFNYTSNELSEIQFTQSADVLYLVHPNHSPITISRTAANTFSVAALGQGPEAASLWVKRWPFRDPNISGISITPSATSGTITLTASAALFNVGHVGTFFRLSQSGMTGAVKITGFTSSTVVTAFVEYSLSSTAATTDWEEASWSDYRGWPRTVCFFGGRLCFGGNAAQPDTVWASKANNFIHFMARKFEQDATANNSGLNYFGATQASDPVTETLGSQQVNSIQWLSPGKSLAVGTLGAEYVCPGLDATAANSFSAESTHGSSFIQAKRSAYTVLYANRTGIEVRELQFEFSSQSYESKNLSKFADHHPIIAMDYQESAGTLWAIDSSNHLLGMTRDRDQQMSGWHYHTLGGRYGVSTPPQVLSVAVAPSSDGSFDDVYFCVARMLNGVLTFTIECMGRGYTENSFGESGTLIVPDLNLDQAPFYSDCATALRTSPANKTWSTPVLAGETVSVMADGFPLPPLTVAGDGTLTLPFPAFGIVVGVPFVGRLKPVRPEAGAVLGSAQGATKRIDRAIIRFHRTVGAKVGPSFTNLEELNFRDSSLPLNEAIPLFSGDQIISFPGSYERDAYICIQQDQPVPMTVLSITLRGDTNES